MNANWTPQLVTRESPQPAGAENRLLELGTKLRAQVGDVYFRSSGH
ncbi:MAG: hypothetical protein WBE44_13455 [Terriglobales bacterium]|jgi:hypothetical protein